MKSEKVTGLLLHCAPLLSYLYDGNPHTWKDGLYIEMGPKWQTWDPFY